MLRKQHFAVPEYKRSCQHGRADTGERVGIGLIESLSLSA